MDDVLFVRVQVSGRTSMRRWTSWAEHDLVLNNSGWKPLIHIRGRLFIGEAIFDGRPEYAILIHRSLIDGHVEPIVLDW